MRVNKLNVLHLHLSEDQSFPLQSTKYPELTLRGAFSPVEWYSVSDLKLFVMEASRHGIRVVPEFDMPGHSTSLRWSHPELFACTAAESERGAYDPTKNVTYDFLYSLLAEYRDDVFSDDFVHLGADEVPWACWKKLKQSPDALFQTFIDRMGEHVLGAGQHPIMWDESLGGTPDHKTKTTPPKGTVIQVWHGYKQKDEMVRESVKKGYWTLLSLCQSPEANWYLDRSSAWDDRMYTAEPMPHGLSPEEETLILGGEGALWGETQDGSDVLAKIFPRMSALAERLWSPKNVTDVSSAFTRLEKFRCLMLLWDYGPEPVGGKGGTSPTRPGSCLQSLMATDKKLPPKSSTHNRSLHVDFRAHVEAA